MPGKGADVHARGNEVMVKGGKAFVVRPDVLVTSNEVGGRTNH